MDKISSVPEMGLWMLAWLAVEISVHFIAFLIDPRPPEATEYIESTVASISFVMSVRLIGISIFNQALHGVLGVDTIFFGLGTFLSAFVSFIPIYRLLKRSTARRRFSNIRRQVKKKRQKQEVGRK